MEDETMWNLIADKGMLQNLIAELLGMLVAIPVTIYLVDRIIQRRSRKESERNWRAVREYFAKELERGIVNFVTILSEQTGSYMSHFWQGGPKQVAAEVASRYYEVEPQIMGWQGDQEEWVSIRKKLKPLMDTLSNPVKEEAQRLQNRLEELVFANLPGALRNEVVTNAWKAYGALAVFLDAGRSDFPASSAEYMLKSEILAPRMIASNLAGVMFSLHPLWLWAVSFMEPKVQRALAMDCRQNNGDSASIK
jgi:hypothetical protein